MKARRILLSVIVFCVSVCVTAQTMHTLIFVNLSQILVEEQCILLYLLIRKMLE